jgi:hypothetical protein
LTFNKDYGIIVITNLENVVFHDAFSFTQP